MRKSVSRSALFLIVFWLLPLKAFSITSLAEITPRIKRELVSIRSVERPTRQDQSYDPYFYFFKQPIPAGQGSFPLGTGFVLPNGKYVATSARSLENLNQVEVVSDSGKVFSASVVGIDKNLDLALLKLEGKGAASAFQGVDFGSSKESRLGDPLYLYGRSLKFVLVKTNLSATENSEGAYGRHWLIDSPTNPAVAGGPIVDQRGRVLGMAVFNPNGPDHFGVVLPAHFIIESAKELAEYGKPQRSWLGIVPRAVPNLDELDHIQEGPAKSGILIENLIVDGPAAKAGLQIGDSIVAINGKDISAVSQLFSVLDKHKAGQSVTLRIHRVAKGVMEIKLTLGELPNARELPNTENLL
ncbi:MAG: PDZ domain-containing protein [Proteobacteria bacterium]|nr:MAG: PDZ domain-containing protein [Pseudomonadota bacterium]